MSNKKLNFFLVLEVRKLVLIVIFNIEKISSFFVLFIPLLTLFLSARFFNNLKIIDKILKLVLNIEITNLVILSKF